MNTSVKVIIFSMIINCLSPLIHALEEKMLVPGPGYIETYECLAKVSPLEYPTEDLYIKASKSIKNTFTEGEIIIYTNFYSPTAYDYFCLQYIQYSASDKAEVQFIYLLGRSTKGLPKSVKLKSNEFGRIGKIG